MFLQKVNNGNIDFPYKYNCEQSILLVDRLFQHHLLTSYGIRASMGDVGACWDNAVVERFFGSLKHDWVLKIPQPTRKQMKEEIIAYMRYYNLEWLHTANGDLSAIEYEQNSLRKVS